MKAKLATLLVGGGLVGLAIVACSGGSTTGGEGGSDLLGKPDAGDAGRDDAGRDGGRDDAGRDGGRDDGGPEACSPGQSNDPPPYVEPLDAGADGGRPSAQDGGLPWTDGYGTTTPPSACTGTYNCSDITQANCTNECFMRYCKAKEPVKYKGCQALQQEVFKLNTATPDSTIAKYKKPTDSASTKPPIKAAVKKLYDRTKVEKDQCGPHTGHDPRDNPAYPPVYPGAIASCEDYVDRKFYTYNRLDQLAAAAQEDPRKLLDFLTKDACADTGAAYITNCVNKKKFDVTAHLGVLDKDGLPALSIDGTATPYEFGDFTGNYPKNYFVKGLPSKFLVTDDRRGTVKDSYGYDYPLRPTGFSAQCAGCATVSFDIASLGLGTDVAKLKAVRYSTSVTAQRDVSSVLKASGYTDDDLNLRQTKAKAFDDVVDKRRVLLTIIDNLSRSIDAQILAKGSADKAKWDDYKKMYLGLMDLDKKVLFPKIAEGQQLGCYDDAAFDASGKLTYAPPCDWSPRIFRDSLYDGDIAGGDLINKAREEVLAACLDVTEMSGSTFSYKKALYGALTHDWSWYLTTARNFDSWFTDIVKYKAGNAKDLATCLAEALTGADPALSANQRTADSSTPKRLGRDNGGDRWEGDKKMFGAGFSYFAKHWVDSYATYDATAKKWVTQPTTSSTSFCKARIGTEVGAYANATLFGANFTLVDMGLGATMKPSGSTQNTYETGRMKVFGTNLWTNAPTGSTPISDSYEFTLPADIPLLTIPPRPYAVPAMNFTLAGIPVTASAYGEIGLGFDGSFTKTLSSVCLLPPVGLDLKAELTVTPYIYLDAVAEVAVGWDELAELGIRGHLSLIRVNLPVTAGARLYQPGTGDTVIEGQAKLNWTLSSLDGSFAWYAELLGNDVTDWATSNPEIFSWDGIEWASGNIWTGKKYTATLPACVDALYNNVKAPASTP